MDVQLSVSFCWGTEASTVFLQSPVDQDPNLHPLHLESTLTEQQLVNIGQPECSLRTITVLGPREAGGVRDSKVQGILTGFRSTRSGPAHPTANACGLTSQPGSGGL
jgi:hypothetical protein